ncbi:hypothetical protein ABW19_dt0207048 [Dactylella cylindrospora]|nr:hypothetical protein ABW19_dt0207048 [Dactylella cylindrospora]
MPAYREGERFRPSEVTMEDGKTSPPGYLTEPELIALMDANGIGTDATMAEHIEKIQSRSYVFCVDKGSRGATSTRGSSRGRGRGGRGAANAANSSRGAGGGSSIFVPSNLGVALVEAYDTIASDMSLSKPFLRKEVYDRFSRSY